MTHKFEAIRLDRYAVIEKYLHGDEVWFTLWDHEEDKQIAVKVIDKQQYGIASGLDNNALQHHEKK